MLTESHVVVRSNDSDDRRKHVTTQSEDDESRRPVQVDDARTGFVGEMELTDEQPATAWTFTANEPIRSAPAVAGSSAYITDTGGSVFAIDATTGELSWFVETTDERATEPVVGDGTVTFSSPAGYLGHIDASSGERDRDTAVTVQLFPMISRDTPTTTGTVS